MYPVLHTRLLTEDEKNAQREEHHGESQSSDPQAFIVYKVYDMTNQLRKTLSSKCFLVDSISLTYWL